VRGTGVRTDARLVETIASNLVSNAIRYTPPGGHVELRVRQRRDKLVLSVRDDGVGIAAEHQTRIFERLYRVDGTRDRATGGSGLGLAIAARAARRLGGHIELEQTRIAIRVTGVGIPKLAVDRPGADAALGCVGA
jgi:signal transduction histidine kinase